MTLRTILLALLFVAAPITGCVQLPPNGGAQQEAAEPPPATMVWPAAPGLPRVRYLHSIASERDISTRPGLFQRFARFLKGEKVESLARPHALTVDEEDRLYVVDTLYRRVHVFDRTKGAHYIFPEIPPDGFVNPVGVATGTGGRVYVSDSKTNVIHIFSSHGRRYEGSVGAGQFERPTGLAFDSANRRLLVIDTVAGTLTALHEGSLAPDGQRTANGEPLPGSAAVWSGADSDMMHGPTHVAIGSDRIFVADSLNFRIQMLDHRFNPVGAFGNAGDQPGNFARPKGVAVDSAGNIYVVDALFGNVQIFDARGNLLMTFGKPGSSIGEFWLASGIFIDKQDRIYVADAWNQRVQVFQYLHHEEYQR